jgi:hypothetical protein
MQGVAHFVLEQCGDVSNATGMTDHTYQDLNRVS